VKLFEHRIEIIPFKGPNNWLAVINRLGLEGWKLVDIKHGGTESIATLVREITK